MVRAVWNGKVIAESDCCEFIEGNYYFPPESIDMKFLRKSKTCTFCPSKGTAKYYNLIVSGETKKDAAWYYTNPKPEISIIKNHITFWKRINIEV